MELSNENIRALKIINDTPMNGEDHLFKRRKRKRKRKSLFKRGLKMVPVIASPVLAVKKMSRTPTGRKIVRTVKKKGPIRIVRKVVPITNIIPTKKGMSRRKERRRARRAARKQARSMGLRGKSKRLMIRKARQDVKARQLVAKAERKGGKAKKRLLKRAKKIAALKGRSGAGRFAKKVIKVAAGSTILLPLQPLRPVMVKILKKRGVSVSRRTKLIDLANLFYNKIIRAGKSSFDDYPEMNLDYYDSDHLAPAIGAIVTAILSYIKNIKNKKDGGQKLTQIEKDVVKATDQVLNRIKKEQTTAKYVELGKEASGAALPEKSDDKGKALFAGIDMSTNQMLIAGGAILLVVLLFFKQSKQQ